MKKCQLTYDLRERDDRIAALEGERDEVQKLFVNSSNMAQHHAKVRLEQEQRIAALEEQLRAVLDVLKEAQVFDFTTEIDVSAEVFEAAVRKARQVLDGKP